MPELAQAPFRKEYKELTEDQKASIELIKTKAEELFLAIEYGFMPEGEVDHAERSREKSVAHTKLEESVMWAVKHYTR